MIYFKALATLIKNQMLKNPQISELSLGNNYQTFLLEENGLKYVLRLPLKKASAKNRLEKSYLILKFIEREGVDFAEKNIFFDKDNNFLLTNYIAGKEVSVRDLNSRQLADFIDKILFLKNLSFKKFNNFAQKEKININLFENPSDRLLFLKRERFKNIKKNKKELLNFNFFEFEKWFKVNLMNLESYYCSKKYRKKDIFFDHGDVAGANIILKNNSLIFIDWDNAKFTQDVGFSLANIFFYCGDFSSWFIEKFVSIYLKKAQNNDTSKKDLINDIEHGLKLIIFSGVLWSLESFIVSHKKDEKKSMEYFYDYQERLKSYNDFCNL
ncbi:MAG: hypothetical protein WCY43_00050 [Patescibacteria group bacterium]|nr:hypothetical protein [Patescibacteria group bacterium]